MFNPQNMEKMMKQMGMDMEEVNAKRVVVDLGDREMVFEKPELNQIKVQGKEMFQLQGEYEKRSKGPSDEDVELVAQKAGVSEDEAREALEEHDDMTDAIMSLK
jgi:nascent polypeptide-associated complex subunit alpha